MTLNTNPENPRVAAFAAALTAVHCQTCLVPSSASLDDGLRHLRDDLLIVPLIDRDSLCLGGPDRQKFLDALVTNNVRALRPGEGCYAGLLDDRGHLQCDLRVSHRENDLFLDIGFERSTSLAATLDRYRFREKVVIRARSAELAAVLIAGPRSAAFVRAELGVASPAKYGWVSAQLAQRPVELTGADWLGETPSTCLWLHLSELDEMLAALLDAATGYGGALGGYQGLEQARLEAGVPRFGVDLLEGDLPIGARADHMLNFEKGCYLGQEIIARVDSRGKANRFLVGVRIAGQTVPSSGAELVADGSVVGHLTTVGRNPAFADAIALAWVKRGWEAVGTSLSCHERAVTVVGLPFDKPSSPASERA
ncbi:MAG: hypothetical protein AUK47_23035 [Deltaproteobacteria bacterium CG2_30_63_29]|nr:MAG: hypothetical protein AUK47_23035 [Deltaproteobacteria bacterium CG2_30_63_29]PIW01019.1 MAG: hypothetical protein COW42_06180 [Deltaproteobacteria bacterium CG17_big_fil_post_rev_8_21_14_2_50_63_7]PJB34807.1 MAG: hypothetical protein CO108_27185 [Deltaproteobacteria bacterium CG_4_9_14_3_um_filter_63_12]